MQSRQLKSKAGVVIRKSGDKTIIVEVERFVLHPSFGKYVRRRKNFHVHDAKNVCQIGDKVEIVECRPISKTKTWKVAQVVAHGLYIEKGVDDTAKLRDEETVKEENI